MIKNPPVKAGDVGLIPGLGRSLGEGNGNPLRYAYLGNSMDRGAWWATVHGVTSSLMQLSMHHARYKDLLDSIWNRADIS